MCPVKKVGGSGILVSRAIAARTLMIGPSSAAYDAFCLRRLALQHSKIARFSILALTVSACSVFTPSGGGGGTEPLGPTTPTGCLPTPSPHLAPGGYYTNGNTVCTAANQPHLFHGVDRPSLEWSSLGENMVADDFTLMASWKANVVRIALNQDFWLSASQFYDASYAPLIDMEIGWAEAAGMDVILDLHWSDAGQVGSCAPNMGCQQLMADANSITFWTDVATRYKGDGRVLFELYNEPHDVSWPVWQSGGATSEGWNAAGMQQLYDAVRATGAENVVIAGGLYYAYDLSDVAQYRVKGYNIMYATHPYGGDGERAPANWDHYFGDLTKTDPVIATEFGDGTNCDGSYSDRLIQYADLHNMSWTAWAWFPGGCSFPSLINDWNATPSMVGTIVKSALASY
jgi:endoglucanase